ncbi:MAG: sigma 54-interacting transcriptional regulator, partial [Candidatus Poribacteria bacterium]
MNSKYRFPNIIGHSDAINKVFDLMEQAAEADMDILITGETGTGKELVAKEIHDKSSRKDKPLLALNCGAIPREALVSELFGHSKGAFTVASEDKAGLFEAASGGVVILDEIGDTPLDVQPNLLRVLEEHKVQRLGETISRDVNVRVIAITNRNLTEQVEAGRFREDLYSRLNRLHIHLPPLRERLEDIPLLAEHFYREACRQTARDLDGLAPDVLDMLQNYHWPGNVRELR